MIQLPQRPEDFQLKATLITPSGGKLTNIRCKIFLPKERAERAAIYLLPTETQSKKIGRGYALYRKFQFTAQRKEANGDSLIVTSDEVFTINVSSKFWDKNASETIWKAEPIGIKIQHKLRRSNSPTEVRFWITRTSILHPVMMITNDWRGHRRVRRHYIRKYRLANGLRLKFDQHFDSAENADGDDVIKSHLVGITDFGKDKQASKKIDAKVVRELDDFLLVAGLALRIRSLCYGWKTFDSIGVTEFYRGDVTRPETESRTRPSQDDELIDPSHQQGFLKVAYRNFAKDASKDLLRDAIYANLPHAKVPLESIFTNMFSAIETLVLAFRRAHGLELIFSEPKEAEEWKRLRDVDLKTWLKAQPLLATRPDKRSLVYENLTGLERISFSFAFKKFCEAYGLDLSDLWPIGGGGEKNWSLTLIRNKLVHGDVLGSQKLIALDVATAHVQWTLERMLLAYLGWNPDKSTVSRRYLSSLDKAHREKDKYREIISE